tara:strand:+ start:153 stop:827 length:675 start_codon:yes stop_codon:yes gene_type:complete
MPDSEKCWVAGLQNTGTNLLAKVLTKGGCAIPDKMWKHRLLDESLLDRKKGIVDKTKTTNISILTRHPYCWAAGIQKAPYEFAPLASSFDKPVVVKHADLTWKADSVGGAWNKYMQQALDFQSASEKHPEVNVAFVPYESMLDPTTGLRTLKDAFPNLNVVDVEKYRSVLEKPAKTHGKPRSLRDSRRAAETRCMDDLTDAQVETLRKTVDPNLAAQFKYDLGN